MSESPKQDLEMLDKPSMPLSQFMAGWQVYKAKDIEDYCEELRKAKSLLLRETIETLTECIEVMDKLARKQFPQLGITDARYGACFKAIALRNKLGGGGFTRQNTGKDTA